MQTTRIKKLQLNHQMERSQLKTNAVAELRTAGKSCFPCLKIKQLLRFGSQNKMYWCVLHLSIFSADKAYFISITISYIKFLHNLSLDFSASAFNILFLTRLFLFLVFVMKLAYGSIPGALASYFKHCEDNSSVFCVSTSIKGRRICIISILVLSYSEKID